MSKVSQTEFIAGREKRILQMIHAGATVYEMADRFGLEFDNMAKMRRDIAYRNGIKLTSQSSGAKTPFGMDDQSRLIRKNLSNHLVEATKKFDIQELPELLGIPKKTIDKLKAQGFKYNWTLAQMQRLCKALYPDMPFLEFWNDLTKESDLKGQSARETGRSDI